MGVSVEVSVGAGVKVNVKVGMGVKVSVGGRGVDVSTGEGVASVEAASGADEAGACPALEKLQAAVARIKRMGNMRFGFMP